VSQPATAYSYRLDRRPDSISRPDGVTLTHQYDPFTGRLEAISSGAGTRSVSYDNRGRVAALTTDQGTSITYDYDGFLVTGTTLESEALTTSALDLTYNSRFEPTTETLSIPGRGL
jgi:uncharacterized protein RhaS with RHS repeats